MATHPEASVTPKSTSWTTIARALSRPRSGIRRPTSRTPPSKSIPLILLSHGDKGQSENLAWLAERLAENGYLVAGINHWRNTTLNNEPEETVWLWHRPQDLSFVLTELIADPSWGQRIDPNRIGVAGHSSGATPHSPLPGPFTTSRPWRPTVKAANADRTATSHKKPISKRSISQRRPRAIETTAFALPSPWLRRPATQFAPVAWLKSQFQSMW